MAQYEGSRMISRIKVEDEQLKDVFQIELLGITLDTENNELHLSFFGNGYRNIVIGLDPLKNVGSGTITNQGLFDYEVSKFNDLPDE